MEMQTNQTMHPAISFLILGCFKDPGNNLGGTFHKDYAATRLIEESQDMIRVCIGLADVLHRFLLAQAKSSVFPEQKLNQVERQGVHVAGSKVILSSKKPHEVEHVVPSSSQRHSM